ILKQSERHLSAIEIELLAITEAIKRFRHYLLGRFFTILTDCNPLTFLMRTKNINSKMSRAYFFLQEFNFEIKHRRGIENVVCDYLSRYTNNKDCEIEEDNKNVDFVFLSEFESRSKNKNKSLRKAAMMYELQDGKLYKVNILNDKFVNLLAIPQSLVPLVLQCMHDCILGGGHLGIRKTFERIKTRFYWKTMFNDVVKWVTSCNVCQQTKQYNLRLGKLNPITPGNRPFSKIGIDIIGLLPRSV
ncbi:pol polyprotein-like protein, partial [Leptotrombidium deliense]